MSGPSFAGEAAVSGDPLPELIAILQEEAQSEAGSPGRGLAALARLNPLVAVRWLGRCAEEASRWEERELAAALSDLAGVVASERDAAAAAALVDVLPRFPVGVDAEPVAALAAMIPPAERGPGLRSVMERALRREPAHAGLLRVAAEAAVAAGAEEEARRLLDRLARSDSRLATVQYVKRLRGSLMEETGPGARIALLSSFTINPLLPYLDLECRSRGIRPEIYVAPFNTWAQEMLGADTGLRGHQPEIVFLSVSIDDLVGGLDGVLSSEEAADAGDMALERVLDAVRRFTSWSDAILVVHSFHSAFRDPLGVLQGRVTTSRTAWLARLNDRLADAVRAMPRVYLLDMQEILLHRSGGPIDQPKLRHMAGMRLPEKALGDVARAYMRYLAPLKGLTRKCIVLDLDNTLWGGVVGEDGMHGIRLGDTAPGSEYREFQGYLRDLARRGFLLAVNSKNNEEDALQVIREHPSMVLREEAFAATRINWLPKPDNMRSLAEELSLGLDSFVFLDDNPNERELMRQALPEVLTAELPTDPALYRSVLEGLPELQMLVVTEEDLTRVGQYRARRQRDVSRLRSDTLESYLESLEIALTVRPAAEDTLPRIHQLFQRTNQFNLTTRRYEAGELAAAARDPASRLYTVSARDRFGDHGLVATALVRAVAEGWVIDSLLMSCRVIGYGVETALLAAIVDDALAAGAARVVGEFVATAKNAPARDFYERHAFTHAGTSNGTSRWHLVAPATVAFPSWIAIERTHAA
jgi:FkbH-like protein